MNWTGTAAGPVRDGAADCPTMTANKRTPEGEKEAAGVSTAPEKLEQVRDLAALGSSRATRDRDAALHDTRKAVRLLVGVLDDLESEPEPGTDLERAVDELEACSELAAQASEYAAEGNPDAIGTALLAEAEVSKARPRLRRVLDEDTPNPFE